MSDFVLTKISSRQLSPLQLPQESWSLLNYAAESIRLGPHAALVDHPFCYTNCRRNKGLALQGKSCSPRLFVCAVCVCVCARLKKDVCQVGSKNAKRIHCTLYTSPTRLMLLAQKVKMKLPDRQQMLIHTTLQAQCTIENRNHYRIA